MSLSIIKAGVLDTIQDLGRYGFQHLGINPGGAMDRFASRAVNLLVGNDAHEAVVEMHFPASIILFDQESLVAIGGADFSATINGEVLPLWQPVIVSRNSILQFQKWKDGARCYLAVREKLAIPKWLGSYSTNMKAAAGGFQGRSLQKGDWIGLREKRNYNPILKNNEFHILPWKADIIWNPVSPTRVAVMAGNEWNWLTDASKNNFLENGFTIGALADRMGYRLQGTLQPGENYEELVSSVVSFGTIQLLPSGELIMLMADHQTTGGYPRIAHVISTHLPMLAQCQPGDKIFFRLTDQTSAEEQLMLQQQHLLQLQNACTFRLQEYPGLAQH